MNDCEFYGYTYLVSKKIGYKGREEFKLTLETAKEFYFIIDCDTSRFFKQSGTLFYKDNFSIETLLSWNDEFIMNLIDENLKIMKNEITCDPFKKVLSNLSDILYVYSNNKDVMLKKILHLEYICKKFGYFFLYWILGEDREFPNIQDGLLSSKLIDKNNKYHANNLTHIMHFYDADYNGLIPMLVYQKHYDLLEYFVKNIFIPSIIKANNRSEIMLKCGFEIFNSKKSCYMLPIILREYFKKHNIDIEILDPTLNDISNFEYYGYPEILEEKIGFEEAVNYKLNENTAKELYLLIDCDTSQFRKKAGEDYYKDNYSIETLLSWNDEFILNSIEKCKELYNRGFCLDSFKAFGNSIYKMLKTYTNNKEVLRKVIEFLEEYSRKVGYFIYYNFKEKNVKGDFINPIWNGILYLDRAKELFNFKPTNWTDISYFYETPYEGLIPTFVHLKYYDLLEQLINNIVIPSTNEWDKEYEIMKKYDFSIIYGQENADYRRDEIKRYLKEHNIEIEF